MLFQFVYIKRNNKKKSISISGNLSVETNIYEQKKQNQNYFLNFKMMVILCSIPQNFDMKQLFALVSINWRKKKLQKKMFASIKLPGIFIDD